MDMDNVFQVVQEKFSITAVAKDLGLDVKRVGGSFRSNSIDNSGRGQNALALYESSNTWYDFMLQKGGDITNLVADVKFNGDIKQALHFLLPDFASGKISEEINRRNSFLSHIDHCNDILLHSDRDFCVRAREYLHSRHISDETIKQLKIGIDSEGSQFRILVPFWDEAQHHILYFVTRSYDYGHGEHDPKYKNASLSYYPFLRNSPLGLNTLNRKKGDTLVITEGIFDWFAFYQEGYSVLASHGGEFGKLWQGVLEKIKDFKHVLLAYDSDDAGQMFTYKAAKVLLQHNIPFSVATLLTKDVAEHYELTGNLEAIFHSARNGLNWFAQYITPKKNYDELTVREREIANEKLTSFIKDISRFADASKIHSLLISLRKYFPADLISGLLSIARKGPDQLDIALSVINNHSIMFNPRAGFYEYQQSGFWKKVDDEVISGYIMKALGKFATGGKLSSILKLVQANPDVLSDDPIASFDSKPLVCFPNGTLHIDTLNGNTSFSEHRRDDFATVQLPFFYRPEAKCPNWLKFISDITNGRKDDQAVLQEFAGYPLLPHCKFQKALMLKGGGSNGKSVFFNILKAIFGGIDPNGRGYVSTTDPSKWAKDFRSMPLRTSWLNISYDMEQDMRGSEGIFKKVVAGEVLEDSYKHKDPISFRTRSKLIMACNHYPLISDTSEGFMRRWLIVELPMHFVEKGKARPFTNDRELDPYLEDKLMKELPGIFNWLLQGLQRLLAQKGFTHSSRQDTLIGEFIRANNPLYSFVEDNIETFKGSDEGHIVPRYQVFKRFSDWAERNKVLPLPSNRFYSNMQSIFSNLSIPFDEDNENWIFYFKDWDGENASNW